MSTKEVLGIRGFDPSLLVSRTPLFEEVKERKIGSIPVLKHEKESFHWYRIREMLEATYGFSSYAKTDHLRLREVRQNDGGLVDMLQVGEDRASKRSETFEIFKNFSIKENKVFKGILDIYSYSCFKKNLSFPNSFKSLKPKIESYLQNRTDGSLFFNPFFDFNLFYDSILQHQIIDILNYNMQKNRTGLSLQNIIECFPKEIPKEYIAKALDSMMGFNLEQGVKWILEEEGTFKLEVDFEEESLSKLRPYILREMDLHYLEIQQQDQGYCIIL